MPRVQESIEVRAPANDVWRLLGDPARIDEWHPYVARATLRGSARSCTFVDGSSIEETILDHSDTERFYVYEITAGASSLRGYVGRFSLVEQGDTSLVRWEGEFEVDDPASEAAAAEQTREIYRAGLEQLRDQLEAEHPVPREATLACGTTCSD